MSAIIGALRGVLSLDSAAFESGAKRSKASMGDLERRMVRLGKSMETAGRRMSFGLTLPMVGAATIAVKSSLKVIDAQAKMAQSLGTTVRSMQVLERAADLSGVSMGEVQQATIQMTKRLSQAAGGTGAAAKALTRLHLSASALQALPLDERLAAVQGALAQYVPEAERAAVASDLFGSRAGLIFTRIDSATLKTASEDVRRFGVAVSEVDADQIEIANDAISRLGLVSRGLANQVTVALAPLLEDLADKGAAIAEWFAALDDGAKRWAAGLATAAAAIGPVTLGLGLVLKLSAPVVQGLVGIAVAARAVGVAMWAATGPWGVLAGLAAAAGTYLLVFGEKSKTAEARAKEAAEALAALNGEMAIFHTDAAPSSGQAAIEAANKYYELAKAAREAAAAELAHLTAENARYQSMIQNGNLRELSDKERAIASERLSAGQRALIQAEAALAEADRRRNQTAKEVMATLGKAAKAEDKLNDSVDVSIEATGSLGKAMAGAKDEALGLADAMDTTVTSAVDGVARSFGDWVAGGFRQFENLWDGLKTTARQGLADLAATFARNKLQLVLGISASGLGAGLGTAASAAGTAVGSSGGGLLGGVLGNAAGGVVSGGGLLSGIGSGVGGILSGGGLGASFANLGGLLSGSVGGLGAIGAALPALGLVLGGVALLSKAFSRKYAGSGISGSLGSDGFSGAQFDFYKGGWFRSDKTKYKPLDADLKVLLDDSMSGVTSDLVEMAGALGLSADAIEGFTGAQFKIWTNGKTAEQIQEALQKQITKSAEGMAELILTTDKWSETGETALETMTRLSSGLLAVNDAMDLLGDELFKVSLRSADAAADLVAQFGDAETMASAVNTYFSGFYSEAEQVETLTRRLGDQFADLGLRMPQSRDGFRDLVEGIDLTTEAGRALYAGVLQLSGAMNELLPTVASYTAAMSGLLGEIGGEIGDQVETARTLAADAREAASLWYRTATTLRGFMGDLLNSDLTGASRAQTTAAQEARLQQAVEAARGGDVEAAQSIPELARAYLRSAQQTATSAQEYRRIAAVVQGQVAFAAGIADLEGANSDVLAGLYERQIEVLTSLGNFLQLEGLTGEEISALGESIEAMASDWDGTVSAFESALGALEAAISEAEAFSYDDLVGRLDVAVALSDTAPAWLRKLVQEAETGIETTLDFIIRRDDLTAADRWLATTALSEHVTALDFVLRNDLDRQTRKLVLETSGDLRRNLTLELGRDLDGETRTLVLTRSATLSRRVNLALTNTGRNALEALSRLQSLVGTTGNGKITFDGGLSFTPDAAFETLFGDLSDSTTRLEQPLSRLHDMLGQLRDAVNADREARAAETRIAALQVKGETLVGKNATAAGAETLERFNALRAAYGVSLTGQNGSVSLDAAGLISPSFDYYSGTAQGITDFKAALKEEFGTETAAAIFEAANSKVSNAAARIESLRAQIRTLGGIPAFASGGVHTGGWRLVGERGWELENTGPSRVVSHSDSVAMLDNRPVVRALDQVNARLEALTRQQAVLAQRQELHMKKTAQLLEAWDEDGQPEVRA